MGFPKTRAFAAEYSKGLLDGAIIKGGLTIKQ
jgi:hypothetical protein